MAQIPSEGGAVLGNLGMAVVNAAPDAAGALAMEAGEDSAILAVEPEGIMYALSELKGVSIDYLRGFRDCAQSLYTSASSAPPGGEGGTDLIEAAAFLNSPTHTWGLIATRAATSRFSGQGINVAILDTGLFLSHPRFRWPIDRISVVHPRRGQRQRRSWPRHPLHGNGLRPVQASRRSSLRRRLQSQHLHRQGPL